MFVGGGEEFLLSSSALSERICKFVASTVVQNHDNDKERFDILFLYKPFSVYMVLKLQYHKHTKFVHTKLNEMMMGNLNQKGTKMTSFWGMGHDDGG